ncbi:MAG: Crp/Fnr family transcriptional regulator [Bacteroidales bacterium]|nr:Crp/Fnr family transcriptional regulator [Bacteroidales bacterium]
MESLKNHINNYLEISETTFSEIARFFSYQGKKKKEYFLREGEEFNKMFFIESGCVNISFIKDNGQEQTIDFAIENWWTSDFLSFSKSEKSRFSIRAIEDTSVIILTKDAKEKLLVEYPFMETYFRAVFEKAYAASQNRIKLLYELSREEAYFHFRDNFPEFIQRVPQYLIASFLGFTPEYLSEIRKKSIS